MAELTQIMCRVSAAHSQASDELLPLVYGEFRKLASARMANERVDHTLQSTGLVHEAYLRLTDVASPQSWDSRGHFFSAAAEAMRRILVDHARSAASQKRDVNRQRVQLVDMPESEQGMSPQQLLELNASLQKLEQQPPVVAELVRLRVFASLSIRESAEAMQISKTKAYEHWDFALAWFAVEMSS